MSLLFLIFLFFLFFGSDSDPAPSFSERRAARQIEKQEQRAKPNSLITALERAIADRNIPEIDRLYAAVVHHLGLAADSSSDHLVARDVDRVLKILKTCPVEIRNKQWGINEMNHSISRAESIMRETRQHENNVEIYRLQEEIRSKGG